MLARGGPEASSPVRRLPCRASAAGESRCEGEEYHDAQRARTLQHGYRGCGGGRDQRQTDAAGAFGDAVQQLVDDSVASLANRQS